MIRIKLDFIIHKAKWIKGFLCTWGVSQRLERMGKHTGQGKKVSPSLLVEVLPNKVSHKASGLAISFTLLHSSQFQRPEKRRNDRRRQGDLINDSGNQMRRSLRKNSFQMINILHLSAASHTVLRCHISQHPGKITLRESSFIMELTCEPMVCLDWEHLGHVIMGKLVIEALAFEVTIKYRSWGLEQEVCWQH